MDEIPNEMDLALYYIERDDGYVRRSSVKKSRTDYDYDSEDEYDGRNEYGIEY